MQTALPSSTKFQLSEDHDGLLFFQHLWCYASIMALKPDLIINAGTAGGFKVWLVNISGDSLDMSPHDEGAILANDATLKDMGELQLLMCLCLSVPAIFVKARDRHRRRGEADGGGSCKPGRRHGRWIRRSPSCAILERTDRASIQSCISLGLLAKPVVVHVRFFYRLGHTGLSSETM
ncbi:hypothetical protein HPP92_002565 [Vanilla planifolia]|uniref:Uncharacterized protein n=1 Tax=Vanilla planifolia TaxID=51239 RepID=A0A835VEM5_VANPL|nr:hypothetical protein HPP92_002565 [Vanilla planifolia]